MALNPDNQGKKRPICVCGKEMIYIRFYGYYDEMEYWICQDSDCQDKIEKDFVPDEIHKGAYR